MMQRRILVRNATVEAMMADNGTCHISVYDKDSPYKEDGKIKDDNVCDWSTLVTNTMLVNSEIERSMEDGHQIGYCMGLYAGLKEEIYDLYLSRGLPMKVKHLKTVKYKPKRISKKLCKKILAKSRCFLNTYFMKYVRKQIGSLFLGYRLSIFELAKECDKEKLQLEGYKTLLRFQRVGCCYSFLLTLGGCSLCEDPDKLVNGYDNSKISDKRCSRFDTSKNRSRDWRLFGIKLKSRKRRFIILWKSSKKYNKKVKKEILNNEEN